MNATVALCFSSSLSNGRHTWLLCRTSEPGDRTRTHAENTPSSPCLLPVTTQIPVLFVLQLTRTSRILHRAKKIRSRFRRDLLAEEARRFRPARESRPAGWRRRAKVARRGRSSRGRARRCSPLMRRDRDRRAGHAAARTCVSAQLASPTGGAPPATHRREQSTDDRQRRVAVERPRERDRVACPRALDGHRHVRPAIVEGAVTAPVVERARGHEQLDAAVRRAAGAARRRARGARPRRARRDRRAARAAPRNRRAGGYRGRPATGPTARCPGRCPGRRAR